MRKLLAVALAILIVAAAVLTYFTVIMKPKQRPPSEEKIEPTDERKARGEYLVENVLSCYDCHSERDSNRFGLPALKDKKGIGTPCFDQALGFPGRVCTPNITPDPKTGIGAWTDGELMRAIREGVGRDGEAIFGLMPYPYYRFLSDEDARAIVVYLRSQPPIEEARDRTKLDFPISVFIKLEPLPLTGPVDPPSTSDPLAQGKYLSEIAGCHGCHTPIDEQHHALAGKDYSGGQEFPLDVGVLVKASNITPDPKTGIGKMSKEAFIGRFKAFEDHEAAAQEVPIQQNTVMPWLNYARMRVEDLSAIYDYLQTVPAISNHVRRLPPLKK